jgi:hypothetical protein
LPHKKPELGFHGLFQKLMRPVMRVTEHGLFAMPSILFSAAR